MSKRISLWSRGYGATKSDHDLAVARAASKAKRDSRQHEARKAREVNDIRYHGVPYGTLGMAMATPWGKPTFKPSRTSHAWEWKAPKGAKRAASGPKK